MSKLKIEYVSKESLKPYLNNAKLHPTEQIEQIKNSIREFSFNDPIAVWHDNEIIEGHGRLLAVMEMEEIDTVPIIRLDDLSEEQRRAYMLVHNQLTMNSGFDADLLDIELENINMDMEPYGFELTQDEEQTEIVEDEAPEPPTEPKAKIGDLYILGNHRLICGDSTDVTVIDRLMDGVKADMVFTDPPYGMHLDTDWSGAKSNQKFYKEKGCQGQGKEYNKIIGDNEDFKEDLIKTIFNNFGYCKEIFVWGADYYPELLQGYKDGNMFVWDKRSNEDTKDEYVEKSDKMYGSQFELCWSKNKHRKQIARVKWAGMFGTEKEFDKKRVHPTQKPSALAGWFLDRYSKQGQTVVDLFGGSGSTLIACEQLNRKCYMAEISPEYCDVIIQRYEDFTGQKAVLLSD